MGMFSSQISTKALVPVCRQLATSYGGGIPILKSLTLVCENTNDKKIRGVFADIKDRIERGDTLADAARMQSRYLPPMFIELLATGEVGGRLDVTLKDLARYLEDRLAMNRTIVGKALYPAFQLTVAWFVGTFALGIVRQLSFLHKFDLSGYMQRYAAFQLAVFLLVATAVVVLVALGRGGVLRWMWGYVATYVWPISPITLRFAQARFFRSLALLVASGVPITQAIQRAAGVCANPYVEQDFLRAIPLVKNGCTLVESFAPCQHLSRTAREMLLVGEESGQLEDSLHKVAEYQMEEALHAVNVATRVGEVLISLLVACAVGYIVISFYSNYYGRMFDELKI